MQQHLAPVHAAFASSVQNTFCRGLRNGVCRNGVHNRVCIDNAGSILNICLGFALEGNLHSLVSQGWVSVLGWEISVASVVDTEFPYRVRIVDLGLLAATLFADTVFGGHTLLSC